MVMSQSSSEEADTNATAYHDRGSAIGRSTHRRRHVLQRSAVQCSAREVVSVSQPTDGQQ